MIPIKGKYIDSNGVHVHGTILEFLGGYDGVPDAGVFMTDAPKGDFIRLKLIRINCLYAKMI